MCNVSSIKILSGVNVACLCVQSEEIEFKINLVDLAGSERQAQANTSGERLRVSRALILHHQ